MESSFQQFINPLYLQAQKGTKHKKPKPFIARDASNPRKFDSKSILDVIKSNDRSIASNKQILSQRSVMNNKSNHIINQLQNQPYSFYKKDMPQFSSS